MTTYITESLYHRTKVLDKKRKKLTYKWFKK